MRHRRLPAAALVLLLIAACETVPITEADHLGLIYMAKAGYHPSAATDLWVRMAEASRGRA